MQNSKNELRCFKCINGSGYKILNLFPVKIDFTNGFLSDLLNTSRIGTDSINWTNWRKENLEFLLSRNIKKDSLGLDIGAGEALFHPLLNLENLVSIYFTNYPGINIICDLNLDIPLVSESFDYILMTNLLEHLDDTKVIKEAKRLLKKGSLLYITVPFLLDVHQIPYDFHRYTYLYLINILQTEGFEIEHISPSGDFGTFQTLVEHYYRFPIHNGSLVAKIIWQFQKVINYSLKKLVQVNYRMDYTGGYMITAKSK